MSIFEIDDILFNIYNFIGDYYFYPTFFVNKRFNCVANSVFLPHLYVIFDKNRYEWEIKNSKFLAIVKWCIDDLRIPWEFRSVVYANASDDVIQYVYKYHKDTLKNKCLYYQIAQLIKNNRIQWARKLFRNAQRDQRIHEYERNDIIAACIMCSKFDLIVEFFGPDVKFTFSQFSKAIDDFPIFGKNKIDWQLFVKLINKQKKLFGSLMCRDYNITDIIYFDSVEMAEYFFREKGIDVDDVHYLFMSGNQKLIKWFFDLDIYLPYHKLLKKNSIYTIDFGVFKWVLDRIDNTRLTQTKISEMWKMAQLYSVDFEFFIELNKLFHFPDQTIINATNQSQIQINSLGHLQFIQHQCQHLGVDFGMVNVISFDLKVQVTLKMDLRIIFFSWNFLTYDHWLIEKVLSLKIDTQLDSIITMFVIDRQHNDQVKKPSFSSPLIKIFIRLIQDDKNKVNKLAMFALNNNDYQILYHLHKMCGINFPLCENSKKFWHKRMGFLD